MAARKFSTRSALAFVLPADLQDNVQSIRKVHDKAYGRWPPHINFFFPFLPEEQMPALVPRIRDALSRIQPFTVVLDTIGNFKHGKGSFTVWLGPQSTAPFNEIFEALAPLFPELKNGGREEFVPHMTLGQCKSEKAVETATEEFKEIIGSITCLVDSIQVLVRDEDTAFESLYTVFLGGREPELHANVANRHGPPAVPFDDEVADDQAPAGAAAAAAAADEHPPVSVLLRNNSVNGPHDYAELLGSKKEVSKRKVEEKPLVHFFDDTELGRTSAVAVDTSGSTGGSILRWSISAVKSCVMTEGPARSTRERILNHVISWNHRVSVRPIDKLVAGGCTEPKIIIPVLGPTVKNLLMTTDGEIGQTEVNELRVALKSSNVSNVIALIVGGSSAMERSPSQIEMSVFFPLLEQCVERGGTFMLIFVTKEVCAEPAMKAPRVGDTEERLQARLLMKHQSPRCARFSQFGNPPAEYSPSVTWDDIPFVKLESLSNLLVDDIAEGAAMPAFEEQKMQVPGIQGTVDMVRVSQDLCELKDPDEEVVFSSVGMDQFVCDILPQLLAEGKIQSSALASNLRAIVQKWQRVNLARIEESTRNSRCTELLEEFKRLNELRAHDSSAELRANIARVSDELRPLLEDATSRRQYFGSIVNSVASRVLEGLAQVSSKDSSEDASMLPEAFTLDAVTKRMANRVRRAKIVEPEQLAVASEAERAWNMTNAPPVCTECAICMRDGVPAALMAVDIAKTNTNVLALNVSDVGIDDALTTGLWNAVAFPAGNFCVSCAFACAALGQHPMTRQPVAAVIPCVDLSIRANWNLMLNSLCRVFYGGKSLPSAWLVFFGALEALKREKRFPDALIDAFQDSLLQNTRCNLFPDTSPLGKTEKMLDAMRHAVCLPIDRMVPETWLVTLRNRSIPSTVMMACTVVKNDKSPETMNAARCIVRRQFFKTIVTAVLNAGKRSPANLRKMCHAIEHDIFQSSAGCPLIDTQRLVSITNSNLMKTLFTPANLQNLMNGITRVLPMLQIKTFDDFITPGAFSSFLAYIYENVTRAPVSASQRKVEDFLAKCFKPQSKGAECDVLPDTFFDGAITAPDCDSVALTTVLNAAPFKRARESVRKVGENGHLKVPAFAASHLFSPPVSHCGICGVSFLSRAEITRLTSPAVARGALAAAVSDVLERMKERRCAHFAEVYGTGKDNFVPTASSCLVSLHDSVRRVCNQGKFLNLTVPTRELVIAVLNEILSCSDPGCPYMPSLLTEIALCANDFLQQRANLSENAKMALAAVDIISLKDRLLREIRGNELSGIRTIDAGDMDPELLRQLTQPLEYDPIAESVVAPKKKNTGDDDDDDDDHMG